MNDSQKSRNETVIKAAEHGQFTVASAAAELYSKPNYNITFHNESGEIGRLDFNGPALVFTGNAEESAKVFFDWIAKSFAGRLQQERESALTQSEIAQQDAAPQVVHVAASTEAPEGLGRSGSVEPAGAAPSEREWISVEDRLPDTDGRLCVVYLPERKTRRVDFEYYHAFEGWATDERVSHWMPMPKEPTHE